MQFYATIGAFYLPLTIMIVIYARIYLITSSIARAEAMSKPTVETVAQRPSLTPRTPCAQTLLRSDRPSHSMLDVTSSSPFQDRTCNGRTSSAATTSTHGNARESSKRLRALSVGLADFMPAARRRSMMIGEQTVQLFNKARLGRMSSSHERKATKTLGVIMGAFTACWLPFFILALIKPLSQDSYIPQWLSSLFLWLGYANSLLNPIIYARFNRDFRTPFKHILQCHIRDINIRLRTDNYTEQYGGITAARRPSCVTAEWLQHPRDSMTSAADVNVRVHCPNRTQDPRTQCETHY